MPQFLFGGPCSLCGLHHERLPKCSKCQKLFHPDSCGHLPVETDYERADPDDLLRGMSFAGKKSRPNYREAKCGYCVPFSIDRISSLKSALPIAIERLAELTSQREDAAHTLGLLNTQIDEQRRIQAGFIRDFSTINARLQQIRQERARTWNDMVKYRTEELTVLENHVKEDMQSILYRQHVLSTQLDACRASLEPLEKREAEESRKVEQIDAEIREVESDLVRLRFEAGDSNSLDKLSPYYAPTPGGVLY